MIARRVRELGVYSEIITPKKTYHLKDFSKIKGFILSGGPSTVTKRKFQSIPKKIFTKLLSQKPGKGGEIHITDSIQTLIKENQKFIAHNFSGKYLDCGSMSGYIKSGIEISKL